MKKKRIISEVAFQILCCDVPDIVQTRQFLLLLFKYTESNGKER